MTRETLFVGGPRHGRTVPVVPAAEGELYRVPPGNSKEMPWEYKAAQVTLTFPHPVTGGPGDTYTAFLFVIPEFYPDNPESAQKLQAAATEAALRHYLTTHGDKTTGGPEAVAAQQEPVYVAWCDHPDCADDGEETFPSLRNRARWMNDHNTTTGHQARWENRVKG